MTNTVPDITSSVTYDASKSITDLGAIDLYHDTNDTALVPLDVEPILPSGRQISLEVLFDTLDDGTNRAMFNNQTFVYPKVPTILSEFSLGENATVAQAYGPFSFVLDHLEAFDIVLKNGDSGKHPL